MERARWADVKDLPGSIDGWLDDEQACEAARFVSGNWRRCPAPAQGDSRRCAVHAELSLGWEPSPVRLRSLMPSLEARLRQPQFRPPDENWRVVRIEENTPEHVYLHERFGER